MLEIIALIFLTKDIGRLAAQKGLKPGRWKLYTVLCWFGAEIVGVLIGFLTFGEEGFFGAMLLGIACAVGSYFILKANLKNRPDYENMDDDINRIGVSDLYPPRHPNSSGLQQ